MRLATGALVRCDVPNDGDARSSTPRATRCSRAPARATACGSLGAMRRREELVAAARRVIGRDGFAAATVGDDHARGGRHRSGCSNYHFGSKDEVVAEAFAAAAREDLAALEAISRRFEDPAERLAAYLDAVRVGGRASSWRLWVDAWGESVPLAAGARHARALRRRLARRAGRGAGGRRAPGPLGVRRPAGHGARGWSPCSTASACTRRVHGEDVAAGARRRVGAAAGRARAGRRRCPRRPPPVVAPRRRARPRDADRDPRPRPRRARPRRSRPCCSPSWRRRARRGSARTGVPDAVVTHVVGRLPRGRSAATPVDRHAARSTPSAARAFRTRETIATADGAVVEAGDDARRSRRPRPLTAGRARGAGSMSAS